MVELGEKLVECLSGQGSQAGTIALAMSTGSRYDPHGAHNRTPTSRQRNHLAAAGGCYVCKSVYTRTCSSTLVYILHV